MFDYATSDIICYLERCFSFRFLLDVCYNDGVEANDGGKLYINSASGSIFDHYFDDEVT